MCLCLHVCFSRAMDLLKECSLLKIDDILPFFPDFVTIDHFKVGMGIIDEANLVARGALSYYFVLLLA